MDFVEFVSPIKILNLYFKKKDIKSFDMVRASYLNVHDDLVSLEISLDLSLGFGVLKMENQKTNTNIVLRVLVMPGTGLSGAKPIEIGDGLRKVVLSEFGTTSNMQKNALKIELFH